MKSRHRNPKMIAAVVVGLVVAVATIGCATITEDPGAGDPDLVEEEASNFHTNLRWARYEHAAEAVHDDYRTQFEAIYEERGDDYEIVDMEMKSAEMMEDGYAAKIEVEQQWYELPSTVVETDRFVERWIYEDEGWWLRERLRRDEYRDRDRTFDTAPEEASADEDDGGD